MPTAGPDATLVTPAFVRITGAALAYFVALGVVIPVLPVYVEEELGGTGAEVGIAVGAFAVSAALLRPFAGRIGDRRGRRVLVVGGTLVAGVSILGYLLATNLAILVVMRLVTGAGEAATFVGAATAAQDLAPAERRGEAASYFSVAVYGGIGIGPVIGEVVRSGLGVDAVWVVGAALCGVAAAIAWGMPKAVPAASAVPGRRRLLHPAGIGPGVILALATTGYAGFSAFIPLYVGDVGLEGAGGVFAVHALVVLSVRIFAAPLP